MSRRIESSELENLIPIIDKARETAVESTCSKDHRGAVVFRDGHVLGVASNGPIPPYECIPGKCTNICGIFAMHAERQAIINALESGADLNNSSVLHVKVDENNEIQISGKLRCEDCTGFMMRVVRKGISIREFVILQEEGWMAYEIAEADEITRKNLGL